MCLAALPLAEHPVVGPSTKLRAVPPATRTWRKMLSSFDRQLVDGLQSLTVFGLFTALVSPMYCVRLFWLVFVSVQSWKYEHCDASECRYGIVVAEKPRPTFDQVRFSNEKITTCW